nr:UDP-glucuronosyl UDP-glucosyltransferase domain containing protein [Haemonchus contortus]
MTSGRMTNVGKKMKYGEGVARNVALQPFLNINLVGNGTTKSRLVQIIPSAQLNKTVTEHLAGAMRRNLWTDNPKNPFGILSFLPTLTRIAYMTVSETLDNKELLRQLEAEKFDVAITELFDFIGFGILEGIHVKNIVGVHSITSIMEPTSFAIGQPLTPSFIPASFGVTDDSSDFWTRTVNLLFTFVSWKFQCDLASAVEQAMKIKLGQSATPIWDTVSNMSWMLVNSEPLLDFDRPTLHKIVHVGGLGVHKPKPLSEEWDRVLSLRSRNVLVSFGSVAPTRTMPADMKRTMVDMIKSHPDITFIWKYEQLDDPAVADVENLILSKWTPQTDLLADDRLTLFITHGGGGSMMESATFGKPLIVIPLFGDQIRNAKLIEKFGLGVVLEKSHLRQGTLLNDSLGLVLNNPRYRSAAARMKSLLSQRQFTPQQKLVKTVEMAAQFGDLPEFKAQFTIKTVTDSPLRYTVTYKCNGEPKFQQSERGDNGSPVPASRPISRQMRCRGGTDCSSKKIRAPLYDTVLKKYVRFVPEFCQNSPNVSVYRSINTLRCSPCGKIIRETTAK